MSGHRSERVQLAVDLPPGSGKGPLIDRPALRAAGVVSAPAYRLALSLSALWRQPGKAGAGISGFGRLRGVPGRARRLPYLCGPR